MVLKLRELVSTRVLDKLSQAQVKESAKCIMMVTFISLYLKNIRISISMVLCRFEKSKKDLLAVIK